MLSNFSRLVQVPYANRYITDHWSTGTSIQQSVSYRDVFDELKSGVSNPKYKQQIRNGRNAATNYDRRSLVRYVPFIIRGESLWTSGSYYIRGHGFSTGLYAWSKLIGYPDNPALKDQALNRLKQKLSSQVGNYNAAAPLAEMRELHGLVTYACKGATEFVLAYQDLRKLRGKRLRRRLYDAWLTYSFGVRPLIMDIKGIGDAIAKHLGRSDHYVVLTGAASTDWNESSHETSSTALPQSGSLNVKIGGVHKLSYLYKAGINLNLLSGGDSYGTLPNKLGFDLDSVPYTLWELTPFSWIADYFTNIGDVLDDTLVLPPGTTSYVICDTIYERRITTDPWYSQGQNNFVKTTQLRPGYLDTKWFRREVLGDIPRIGLHFKTEDRVAANAVNRLLNLISVLKR